MNSYIIGYSVNFIFKETYDEEVNTFATNKMNTKYLSEKQSEHLVTFSL
ncbi:hypothetical protein JZO67_004033 [Enterococcus sp. 665A]|uniref:Uncharacterized protein n=1 Tax=Candidatus Enterococcus ferrettii TaxID=2815324 RepID=A0ABV0ETS6_9ENTE